MYRVILIFTLCFTHIYGDSLTVISKNGALSWGSAPAIIAPDASEIVLASAGYPVSGSSKWTGLTILNPFSLPPAVILNLVGVSQTDLKAAGTNYEFYVSTDDLDAKVASSMSAYAKQYCEVNLNTVNFDEKSTCFQFNVKQNFAPPTFLNATHDTDRVFLNQLKFISNMAQDAKSLNSDKRVVIIKLSLADLQKKYNSDLDSFNTAKQELVTALNNLIDNVETAKPYTLFLTSSSGNSRAKRQVVSSDNDNVDYNLAEYYSEDYPVIFNIILWFMVAFGFSLLAICYTIGTMDPGRDSIIYRMTASRGKKDN